MWECLSFWPQSSKELNTFSDTLALIWRLWAIVHSGANWKLILLLNSYLILKVVSYKQDTVVTGLYGSYICNKKDTGKC